MHNQLVVYGAGGHGKVVAEILAAAGHEVHGFIDDNVRLAGSLVVGLPVFRVIDWLDSHAGASVALGIGDNHARERAADLVREHGCKLVIAIHPAAVIARGAKIGDGAAVMPAAVLNPDCVISEGAIVNSGVIVEHDARVGRYAHLAPNSALGGGAKIGDYSQIGMGANVLPLKRIGSNCTIGAGAVVIEDIADNQIAYGVPAKIRESK